MHVDHGRANVLVAKEFLHPADVITDRQEMRGERMPERVAGDPLGEANVPCLDMILGQPLVTPKKATRRKYDADRGGKEHAWKWFRYVDRGGDDTSVEATRLSTEDHSLTTQQYLAAAKSAVHDELGLEGLESEQFVRLQNEE
jgi:hypothetical protein